MQTQNPLNWRVEKSDLNSDYTIMLHWVWKIHSCMVGLDSSRLNEINLKKNERKNGKKTKLAHKHTAEGEKKRPKSIQRSPFGHLNHKKMKRFTNIAIVRLLFTLLFNNIYNLYSLHYYIFTAFYFFAPFISCVFVCVCVWLRHFHIVERLWIFNSNLPPLQHSLVWVFEKIRQFFFWCLSLFAKRYFCCQTIRKR